MSLGYHLCLRTRDGSPLATTTDQRRHLARQVLSTTREFALLAFGLPDNHLHLYPAEERPRASELARRVGIAVTRGLKIGGGLYTSLIKPVTHGSHAYKLFDYVLRQSERHQLVCDPLLEATNLQDLLGLRLLGRRTALFVRRFLPRVSRRQLLERLGVERLEPYQTGDVLPEAIVDAGCAAVALPRLDGSRPARLVRQAIAEIFEPTLTRTHLAELLGVWPRSLRRILAAPAPSDLVQAIRLQLDLRLQKAPALARLAAPFC